MRWPSKSIALFACGMFCGLMLNALRADSVVRAGSRGATDQGPPTCTADIAPPGGDGVVNVNDLLAVINNWGPCADEDQDNDGWTVAEGDCDDANPDVYPGAPEVCNGIDDDCDDVIDEGVPDTGGNTCASAVFLGQLAGDNCSGATLNATGTLAPAGDNDFFRVHIFENSTGDQNLFARVMLTAPAGAASPLLLCVTCDSCGSTSTTCLQVNPGQSGHLTAFTNDVGGPDSFDLFVEVRSVSPSVSICQDYQLTVSCVAGTPQLTCN